MSNAQTEQLQELQSIKSMLLHSVKLGIMCQLHFLEIIHFPTEVVNVYLKWLFLFIKYLLCARYMIAARDPNM